MIIRIGILISYFAFALMPDLESLRAQELETSADSKSIVVWKDMTIAARTEYENIIVMSGLLDLYGKTDKLVVVGGRVKIHENAQVKSKMIVLGGAVEQLEGAIVTDPSRDELEKLGILERVKQWGDRWIQKWKHRFEDTEEGEDAENQSWGRIFVFPLMLTLPIVGLLVIFAIALLFTFVAPKISEKSQQVFRAEPMVSLLWGCLAYLFMTPLIAILTISIIGIPFVPLILLLAVLALLAGFITACRATGAWVLEKIGIDFSALHILFGLFLIYGILFMPFIGKLLAFFILIGGTGAVIRTASEGRRVIRFGGLGRDPRTYDI